MADLNLITLAKHYQQGPSLVRALDGVDLEIGAGQLVSIVGRSGSGKTTLLDLVGLLSRPTSGKVMLDGVDTALLGDGKLADLRGQRIGFVFQEYNLLPTLDLLENVMLPLDYAKPNVKDPRKRALDLIEMVGLSKRLGHYPRQLSGGEQQRVAIARAFVNQPSIVLADEPTGAVDTQTAAELIAVIKRLNREEDVTFMVATHDLELAAQTDRIIRLSDGRVMKDELAPFRVAA
ncbi:MAG: ABC transporter ATP-binding protein [Candidatus Dormibacterales bacterium]